MSGGVRGAPTRVVVKSVNWLGDVVMSLPALRAVRHAFPQATLALLIKEELASFFDGARWLDEVIPYRVGPGLGGLADRRRIVRDLRTRRFDLAVVFPRSFESAFWVALAGVPRRAGFAADARGWLLTDTTRLPDDVAARHQARWYLHLVDTLLGAPGSPDDFVPDVHEPHRARMRAWLAVHRRRPNAPLVALAPAAAYGPAKEWPAAHWTALIDALAARDGTECVLVGSPGERARCEQIAAAGGGALLAAGETSVGELLALLSLCHAFAGNDSGSMHVAAALGLPTVGLFGSTNPDRTAPLGPQARVIYRRIECSPCLARTCRFGHYRCLTEIAPAEVAAALRDVGLVS